MDNVHELVQQCADNGAKVQKIGITPSASKSHKYFLAVVHVQAEEAGVGRVKLFQSPDPPAALLHHRFHQARCIHQRLPALFVLSIHHSEMPRHFAVAQKNALANIRDDSFFFS